MESRATDRDLELFRVQRFELYAINCYEISDFQLVDDSGILVSPRGNQGIWSEDRNRGTEPNGISFTGFELFRLFRIARD